MIVLGLAFVALGFLAGSIPFGFVLAKLFLGVDVRQVGSGNIGATNVARAGGKGMGVVVLLLDVAKAALPMLAARAVLETPGGGGGGWVALVGLAAFLGHVYTPWLGFHGGKGVACGLGVFLVLAPWAAIAGVAGFVIAWGATRMSSLGSLTGTFLCALVAFASKGPSSADSWVGVALAALIFLRHRENIRRLLRGEERKMRV